MKKSVDMYNKGLYADCTMKNAMTINLTPAQIAALSDVLGSVIEDIDADDARDENAETLASIESISEQCDAWLAALAA